MAGRTCIVTGASRGIGLAAALRFAHAGDQLVVAARQEPNLVEARRQIEAAGALCETVQADVSRADDVQRLVTAARARFGRIDVLVNNAGCAPLARIEELSLTDFNEVLALNMAAVFHTMRAVWPHMREQGGGVIVNVSSLASVDPFPGFAVYGASKAWVNLFSQAAATEGKPDGIRVFSVAPGAVETPLLRATFPDFPAEKALATGDVANVIYQLCEESFAPCSGQTFFVRR